MPDNSGFDYGDIINAALALYGIKQGQKAPNFYNVPPTPQEQWKSDAGQNLFNYASKYTDQYLHGLGNLNPDFKLNTNLVGNPNFMGGIKVPQIDWSKMPSAPSSSPIGGTPTNPQAPPPAGGGGAGGAGIGSPSSGATGAVAPIDDRKYQVPDMSPAPGGGPGDLFQQGGPAKKPPQIGPQENVSEIPTGQTFADLYKNTIGSPAGQAWWQKYTTSNPNWTKNVVNTASAVAAFFSLPISIGLKIVAGLMPNHNAPAQGTTPATGGTP